MLARVLLYNDLFSDEEKNITDLLSEIPSNIVIGILSHINAQLYLYNSVEKQNEILGYLVNRIDKEEKERILEEYSKLFNDKYELIAFPIFTVLKLIEHELLNYRKFEKSETTGVDELNILKAIIISNDKYDKIRLSKTKVTPKPNFIQILWILGFDQMEHSKQELNGLMPSLFYAENLFEFLKLQNEGHYNNFLSRFQLSNHTDYLKNYLQLIQNCVKIKENEVHSVINFNLIEKHKFLEKFCIDVDDFNSEKYVENGKAIDFIGLREKPIIKHSNTEYSITNWNFILNKFLLGLMFDYYHSIHPERGNKAFLKFKDKLGEDFVEKTLLRGILEDIFINESLDIQLLSDDKEAGYNFDFYLRIENKVFIIECKDYLMPVKAKSGDIAETEKYLDNRLGGAVAQLHKQIKKFQNKTYNTIEIPYDHNRLFIYPIIVYTDKSFSMPGVNKYLNDRLRNLLISDKFDFFHIWDLNLIHIDFFIQYQGILKDNPKLFISLLNDSYHKKQAGIFQLKKTGHSNDIIKAESNFADQIKDKLVKMDDYKLVKIMTEKLT